MTVCTEPSGMECALMMNLPCTAGLQLESFARGENNNNTSKNLVSTDIFHYQAATATAASTSAEPKEEEGQRISGGVKYSR